MDRPFCLRNRGIGPVPRDCSASTMVPVCCNPGGFPPTSGTARRGRAGTYPPAPMLACTVGPAGLTRCSCLPASPSRRAGNSSALARGLAPQFRHPAAPHRFGQSSQAGQGPSKFNTVGDRALFLVCVCAPILQGWLGSRLHHIDTAAYLRPALSLLLLQPQFLERGMRS